MEGHVWRRGAGYILRDFLERNSFPGGVGGLTVVGQGGTCVEASNRSWEPTQEKRAVDELDDARDITQADKEWT